uniref:LRAT domain-containing protein n=1 Tax=Cyprinus carpio carpio TaxID=630221 RepID=A0A9J7X0B1_CYPCA
LKKNLKPGDVIEIFRDGYQHWVIYVGDGYVIHLVTASGHGDSGSSMKKEKLQDVAGNDKYRINNHLDDTYVPRPIEDILQEAERFVGKEFSYNVIRKSTIQAGTV